METSLCIDTGIVVGILRKEKETMRWLETLPEDKPLAISLITLFELYRGAFLNSRTQEEIKAIEQVESQLILLPLTPKHMRSAAQESVLLQKKGLSVDIRDLLIGICARDEGYALKTKNEKHFKNIDGLQISTN